MVLRSPPAAPGALEEKERERFAEHLLPAEAHERREEVVVVGVGERVEGADDRRRAVLDRAVDAACDAGHVQRALVSSDPRDQRRQRLITFPDDRVVDPRERTDVLRPHVSVVVGPAEDDHDLRPLRLDPPRERERGHVLLEGRREADDSVRAPVDRVGPARDQVRELLVAHTAELVEVAARAV